MSANDGSRRQFQFSADIAAFLERTAFLPFSPDMATIKQATMLYWIAYGIPPSSC
jgi:hypothetical protein